MSLHRDNQSAHPAAQYDDEVRRVIPFYDEIQSETLDAVRSIAGEPATWLDTGAGTGSLVAQALAEFPSTRFVVADPSEAMIAQARQRLLAADIGRVNFLPAVDSAGLGRMAGPLRPQVITAIMCHHYLAPAGRREAVQACHDLLAPGGVLIVFENVECESPRGRELGLERWRRFQLAQGRSPESVALHLSRFGTELKPVRIGEHLALFREVGFEAAEVFWRAHMQAGFYAVKRA